MKQANELLDLEYQNAVLATKKLGGVLAGKQDIGPEQVKLCLYAQVNYQRTHASFTQSRSVDLKCIKYIAGQDLEAQKRLTKEQHLLPDKK